MDRAPRWYEIEMNRLTEAMAREPNLRQMGHLIRMVKKMERDHPTSCDKYYIHMSLDAIARENAKPTPDEDVIRMHEDKLAWMGEARQTPSLMDIGSPAITTTFSGHVLSEYFPPK